MRNRLLGLSLLMATTSFTTIAMSPSVALGRDSRHFDFDLPPQPLADSIRAVAVQSVTTIVADEQTTKDVTAPALRGKYTVSDALKALLRGSGISVVPEGDGFAVGGAANSGASGSDIVVTGTRVTGAELASPVTVLTQTALADMGYADLGDVARNLPQSFGGGQNPGISLTAPNAAGANVGGGSTVNLRGLGSDATLTILNGRRLPYDSALQGVDISAIPMSAVERVEIVADGSSAIYGSDAVAGVVNVILKEDFEGLSTRARIGATTDGGDFQQLYGVLAGHRWTGGGMFVAYEYNRNSELTSNQRSSTRSQPNLTLLPGSQRHAVAAHLHQELLEGLQFEGDVLYNSRHGWFTWPMNAASDLSVSRTDQSYRSYSAALTGALHYDLGDWQFSASGTYGRGRNNLQADYLANDEVFLSSLAHYANRSTSGEISATGPLFALPGGDARIATGAGIRNNGFEVYYQLYSYLDAKPTQDSQYLFGEVNLPLVDPALDIPLVRKLTLSGALRYEHYDGVGGVTTPKLGLIYAPVEAAEFKGTWGKSFRAPGFYNRFIAPTATLYTAAQLGGAGYASSATAMYLSGGDEALKPERATSWSATVAIKPPMIEGATLELTYYSTRYRDRVVIPVTLPGQALSNPIYAGQVTSDPSVAEVAQVIAGSGYFSDATGMAYDPANVVAIVDNRYVNAGRQDIHGLDARLGYLKPLGAGTASFDLNATYLVSRQQLTREQPVTKLAGQLYNPPHWRGRASVSWQGDALRAYGTLAYTGGIVDTRATPVARVRGMTTLDLGARYKFADTGKLLDGFEIGLSANNVFNVLPAAITATLYSDTPYDSTNYSAVGRFIALDIVRKW